VVTAATFNKLVLEHNTGYTIVFLYSSETISTQQRYIAFQFNLAAKLL